ncbi:cytochrome P450 4C1-like [Onthophagus taurus]|uniref:cytochrome P450 4C1-like n=1 Tax=Onthophagus taurus TaxID=166361 RepID=UPI000C20E273|nr:cytochrome P450 4C1-like [Onthophagus taurus]
MSTVLVLLVTTIVAYLVHRYFKNKRFNDMLKKLPSPPAAPIVKHVKHFRKLEGMMEMIGGFLDEYDGMVLLHPGPNINYFAVADHKLLEYLCTNTKNVIKSPRYKLFERWLGENGLFTAEGELWKKHRSLVTPAFHFQILEQFVDTFNAVSAEFIDILQTQVNKEIDIYHYVNLCALDIISETAMGVSVNAQRDSVSKYVHCVQEMLRIIAVRSFSPLKVHDWIFRLTSDYQKEEEAMRVLKGYTNSVIERKQKALDNGESRIVNQEKRRRLAYLDLLLENRGVSITDEDISNSVEGFMFAGHDTTAIAMGCTLYLLATHPDVQQRAFEELRDILGDDKNKVATYKDLQEMKYLEMVIKEALRLFPPAPIISKQILEDYEFNGYVLPKGLSILGMVHCIHRREKYFPNPNTFDPERFSPENQSKILPFSYLPFGAGHRNCVGQKFAMHEMKIVVSSVLRNFELLPIDGFKMVLVPQIVHKPKNGIKVKLVERKY